MRDIIPAVYANGNSPVGGFVLLEGGLLEVEVAAWAILHRRQCTAPHAVADLIRRAIKVGRSRPGIEETALDRGRHGHDGCPQLVDELGEFEGGGG